MMRFALLNFRRTKKSWCLLMGVMILAYTFLTMLLIFFSSMNRSEEEQREKLYGSWHVALLNADGGTREKLEHHATLERMGASRIYGKVLDQEGEELGKAGTADPNTMEMENIELMEGRFPQAEDEAAVERSSFSALGAEPRLGEIIEVRLAVRDSAGEQIITRTYKVVGILQDYSEKMKGTTVDKHDYVTLLLTEQSGLSAYSERWNLVFRLQEKYLQNYGELMMISGYQGNMLLNNYTYFELGEESGYQWRKERGRELGIIVVTLIGLIITIFGISMHNLNKESAKVDILNRLGRERGEIIKSLLRYTLLIEIVISIIGSIIAGIIVVGLVLSIPKYMTLDFRWEIVVSAQVILLLGILVSVITGYFLCNKRRIRLRSQKNEKTIKRNQLYVYHKKITRVLSFLFFCILYLNLYFIWEQNYEYDMLNKSGKPDFKVGGNNGFEVSKHMDEKLLKKIVNVYGVKNVEAYKILDYLPIEIIEGKVDSVYVDTLKKEFWRTTSNEIDLLGYMLGIDQKILNKLNIEMDTEDFINGNSVVVYLPVCYLDKEGYFYMENGYVNHNSHSLKLQEKYLKTGDVIKIGDKEVTIGGILYSADSLNMGYELGVPFTIIGSYSLCEELSSDSAKTYEYLAIEINEVENVVQTYTELSRTVENIPIINNYNKKIEIEESRGRQIVFIFVTLIIIFALKYLIDLSLWENTYKINQRRMTICSEIGMTKAQNCIAIIIPRMKNEILGMCVAGIFVYGCALVKYYFLRMEESSFKIAMAGEIMIKSVNLRIRWGDLLAISIVFHVFVVGGMILKLRKMLKNV